MNILQHQHAVLSMSPEAYSFIASINVFAAFEICLYLRDKLYNFAFSTLLNYLPRSLKYLMHFNHQFFKKDFPCSLSRKWVQDSQLVEIRTIVGLLAQKNVFAHFLITNSQKND